MEAFGINNWTKEEKKVAKRLLKLNLWIVKSYRDKYYIVYDKHPNRYPSQKNEVMFSRDLKEISKYI